MTSLKQTLTQMQKELLNRVEGVADSKRIEEIEDQLVEEFDTLIVKEAIKVAPMSWMAGEIKSRVKDQLEK